MRNLAEDEGWRAEHRSMYLQSASKSDDALLQEARWQRLERECEEQSSLALDKQLAWAEHRCRELEGQLAAARDVAAPAAPAAAAPARADEGESAPMSAEPAPGPSQDAMAATAAAEELAAARSQRSADAARVRDCVSHAHCAIS